MKCPICGTEIDEERHRQAEKLSKLGYLHLDIWLKCPRCKYTPCFGREMEDTKPIYWYPRKLPSWGKNKIVKAFNKHIPDIPCTICGSEMQLHKVWINAWKQQPDNTVDKLSNVGSEEVLQAQAFIVPTADAKISKYLLPSGILGQYKCKSWRCKYVRYVTL